MEVGKQGRNYGSTIDGAGVLLVVFVFGSGTDFWGEGMMYVRKYYSTLFGTSVHTYIHTYLGTYIHTYIHHACLLQYPKRKLPTTTPAISVP